MHFSEDDLRSALRRKDPENSFTRQVMARVNRERQGMSARQIENPLGRLRWSPLRRSLAGAFLLLLIAAAWAGIADYREAQERRAGELAGQQVIAALRITTEKLNHVIERVQAAPTESHGGSDEDN